MIKKSREALIMRLLEEEGVVALRTILERCPDVSAVTLRRDLARMEEDGLLRRTHGGAMRLTQPETAAAVPAAVEAEIVPEEFDALILPPVRGAWAHTLRQQAIRRGTLLVAESAPQIGGIYLGPRNFEEARKLGEYAARQHRDLTDRAEVLLVALSGLQNTQERLEGFRAGFEDVFPGKAIFRRIVGLGLLKDVVRQAGDAFQAHRGINIAFGANDHTILGVLEAAQRHDLTVAGYSVGGEGGNLFSKLVPGGPLKAVVALFPEVVGRVAVDSICSVFDGADLGGEVITPAIIMTPENLEQYYTLADGQWHIVPEVLERLSAPFAYQGRAGRGRSIAFMQHYPSHEWYRVLAAAMRTRAGEQGATLISRRAEDEVADEIRLIKRRIAAAAANSIAPGETLLIDGGECSRYFAEALRPIAQNLKVYTNSLDVLDILAGAPGLSVFLTGGEYRASTRTLVGPSVGSLLATIRVDKAVVSPDGISTTFGLSFEDERLALVCGRFCATAREVLVLADHSVIGLETSVQAVQPTSAYTVFTDAGTLSAHRFELSTTGLSVVVADQEDDEPQSAVKQAIN